MFINKLSKERNADVWHLLKRQKYLLSLSVHQQQGFKLKEGRFGFCRLGYKKEIFMVTAVRHCNGPNIQPDLSLTQPEKRDGEVGGSQGRKLAWEIQN